MEVTDCKTALLNAETVSGAMRLQLPDSAANYKMTIDTGPKAQITINRKSYPGGELVLHQTAANEILFDTETGSLAITEASPV